MHSIVVVSVRVVDMVNASVSIEADADVDVGVDDGIVCRCFLGCYNEVESG